VSRPAEHPPTDFVRRITAALAADPRVEGLWLEGDDDSIQWPPYARLDLHFSVPEPHLQAVRGEFLAMLRRAGNYFVVGYGENINVPTIDIISTEINFIGNLVGSYNDLQELMTMAAQGRVTLHTTTYPLEDFQQALDDLDAGRVRGRAILVP